MFIMVPGDEVPADNGVEFSFCSTADRREVWSVGVFDEKLGTETGDNPSGAEFVTQDFAISELFKLIILFIEMRGYINNFIIKPVGIQV